MTSLFFEPSTRTRSSFELAARRLSADVQSFSPSSSSLSKGESLLDTALTYVAMGANILVVRHRCAGVPRSLARDLERAGRRVAVLNAGDGLHSHPSQGLLDLFTLARHFEPANPSPASLAGRRIVIVGDVLHSRVARSNLWALTACGAEVVLYLSQPVPWRVFTLDDPRRLVIDFREVDWRGVPDGALLAPGAVAVTINPVGAAARVKTETVGGVGAGLRPLGGPRCVCMCVWFSDEMPHAVVP